MKKQKMNIKEVLKTFLGRARVLAIVACMVMSRSKDNNENKKEAAKYVGSFLHEEKHDPYTTVVWGLFGLIKTKV